MRMIETQSALVDVAFLVIGHVCLDLTPSGAVPGGTATYAAITARNLGSRASILTRADQATLDTELLQEIDVHILPSVVTTKFENVYHDRGRTQYLRARAESITREHLPCSMARPDIVLLGPLAQEVEPAFGNAFAEALVGATPQGWMRRWDERGEIFSEPGLLSPSSLGKVTVIMLSHEDISGRPAILAELVSHFSIVVLTSGVHGATVYHAGRVQHIEARHTHEVDPTGAGDVFAAAFLIRLWETDDCIEAARFANMVASYSVEKLGPAGIPRREQLIRR